MNRPAIRSYVVPTPEQIARGFHEAYETFAAEFGYSTRKESAVPWEDVPEANRALMIATVRQVVIEQHNLLRIAEAAQRIINAREMARYLSPGDKAQPSLADQLERGLDDLAIALRGI